MKNIHTNQTIIDSVNEIIFKLEKLANTNSKYYLPLGKNMPIENFNDQLFQELKDVLQIINSILTRFYDEIPTVNIKLKTLQDDIQNIINHNPDSKTIKALCDKYKLDLDGFNTRGKLYSRLSEIYAARLV